LESEELEGLEVEVDVEVGCLLELSLDAILISL
jgi:hypothetical protein